MIQLGALVEYQGTNWKVLRIDLDVDTLVLQDWDLRTQEVASDDPEVKLIANTSGWPFVVSTPRKGPRARRITKLVLTKGPRPVELEPLKDWTPVDIHRIGGPVFFHPRLRLRHGDTLVAHYEDETSSRITIPPSFGSSQLRAKRADKLKPKKPASFYDVLFDGDDD